MYKTNFYEKLKENYWLNYILYIFIIYVAVLFYSKYMGINNPYSDGITHWNHSQTFYPFDVFHVPVFVFSIGLLRIFLETFISPLGIIQIVLFFYFFISIIYIYKSVNILCIDRKISTSLVFLFFLWPFIGVTSAIIPGSDYVAIALFSIGVFYMLSNELHIGAIFFGFTILAHKAMWPITFFIFSFHFIKFYKTLKIRTVFIYIILYLTPLIILWIFGSIHHNNIYWIIESNIRNELSPDGSIFLFDGLIGPILNSFDFIAIVKWLLIISIFVLSIILLKKLYPYNDPGWSICMGILTAIILYCAIIEEYEIWAIVRYGRLLVFPVALFAGKHFNYTINFQNKYIFSSLIVLLSLSQFIFIRYVKFYMDIN
ncbi:MAG: hypothetical protein CMI96_01145 [Pelagibacteraceae bacterium]|nr:hypothetical protein [Pelagibacteraceae bacterium]|tara:strand:+ start:21544 stop:22659 length:1116 start_codon:yes stop_codon:yes gene_type:complete